MLEKFVEFVEERRKIS